MGHNQVWRKRVRGTSKQIGKSFVLDKHSAQSKKANLPKAIGKVRTQYPTGKVVQYSIEDMPIEQLSTKATIIQDSNPENFEARVQHFIDMYNNGETIPPILYHRLPLEGGKHAGNPKGLDNGQIQLLDGRARLEAFRRLGISKIPAVENGILSNIKSGLSRSVTISRGVAQGVIAGEGGFKTQPKSNLQAQGRRIGVELREGVSSGFSDVKKSYKGLYTQNNRVESLRKNHTYKGITGLASGKGTAIKGTVGGGDMVIPNERSQDPVTTNRPLEHRPCVVERVVRGKVLRTYGTLLDPRTNPRYLQKYGYTDVE